MRLIAIGLAAALLAVGLSPVAASAADKPAKPTADSKNHDQGMTEAPPLVQQSSIPCTMNDARFIGQGKSKNTATGKEEDSKYYEVACQEGLGYIIISPVAGTPIGYDCLMMSTNKPKAGEKETGQVYCKLPGNTDPLKSFQPILAKGGISNCTPSQGRWIGITTDFKLDQYEIACSEGMAYIISYPRLGTERKFAVGSCLDAEDAVCQYYPKEKRIAQLSTWATPAKRPCQVTDGRYLGTLKDSGNTYYEIACSDQISGFVLEVDPHGMYVTSIDCAKASTLAGGCTLTNAVAAQTQEIGTYSKLAKSIGFACDVKSYHSFGADQSGREVVELVCNDHPDGVIAILPVDKGQKGEYFNCARAEIRQLKCALTPPQATYAKLSSQIAGAGKTCQVSNARGIGTTKDGAEFVETACSGAPGAVIEYQPNSEQVKAVMTCAQASAAIGQSCTFK